MPWGSENSCFPTIHPDAKSTGQINPQNKKDKKNSVFEEKRKLVKLDTERNTHSHQRKSGNESDRRKEIKY